MKMIDQYLVASLLASACCVLIPALALSRQCSRSEVFLWQELLLTLAAVSMPQQPVSLTCRPMLLGQTIVFDSSTCQIQLSEQAH
jgi:hypothetical protein